MASWATWASPHFPAGFFENPLRSWKRLRCNRRFVFHLPPLRHSPTYHTDHHTDYENCNEDQSRISYENGHNYYGVEDNHKRGSFYRYFPPLKNTGEKTTVKHKPIATRHPHRPDTPLLSRFFSSGGWLGEGKTSGSSLLIALHA